MRSLSISSQSSIEPIDTSAVNAHLKIQTTLEDTLMLGYIRSARIQLENKIKRALIPTSFCMQLDDFADTITLLYPPLSTSATDVVITYVNGTGTTSTVASTVYTVDWKSEPGRIYLAFDAEWPTDVRDVPGAIKISYAAGYTTATIPENAALWLKLRAAEMYKYREPIIERGVNYLRRDFLDGLIDNLFNYSTE